jgi:hypothetical protein
LALETTTRLRSLAFCLLQPGQIVHVNDVTLLHKELQRKRRYAMVGHTVTPITDLVAIEIIPMTHAAWGPMKVSFFDAYRGCRSYLCFGLTTLLTPEDVNGTRVRVTSRFVPGATGILARHSHRRPVSAPSLAA